MAFHVPESARVIDGPMGSTARDGHNGAFDLESPEPGWRLALICSDGTDPDVPEADGWEHVSVHAYRQRAAVLQIARRAGVQVRIPTWKEMAWIKELCWDAEDVVMQLHPKRSQYVNLHPAVLHLWRSRHVPIPTPPAILVGPLVEAAR